MKKIISIFTSLVLVLSMLFSFAAVEALASAPEPLYDYTTNIDASKDTIEWTKYNNTGYIASDGGQKNHTIWTNPSATTIQSDGMKNVIKIGKQSGNYFDICAKTDSLTGYWTSGIYEIKCKMMVDHTPKNNQNWRVYYTSGNWKDYYTAMLGSNYLKLTPNKWYDFTYRVNLDEDYAYEAFIDPENPSDKTKSFEKTQPGYSGDFVLMRAYVSIPEGNYLYLGDLQVSHRESTPYYKSSILCIGSDASAEPNPEIAEGGKEISFRLDNEVPNLKTAKMVYIEDSAGKKNYAKEISITSAGSDAGGDGLEDIMVTATLESEMPAWTDYTLHIDKSCYKDYRYEDSGVYKSIDADLTATFRTSTGEFAVKDPIVAMSDGEVEFKTSIINTAESTYITAVLAIYNSKGNMVKVKPVTLPGTNFAYPGYPLIIREELSDGETAKLFMINGWGGLKPLFGKMWQTSYSELNP